jgi:hypothetical protein
MPSQEVAQVEMGNYSSEEKAIKVLDMVQGQYAEINSLYNRRMGIDIYIVFQMPQDSEV